MTLQVEVALYLTGIIDISFENIILDIYFYISRLICNIKYKSIVNTKLLHGSVEFYEIIMIITNYDTEINHSFHYIKLEIYFQYLLFKNYELLRQLQQQ